MVRQAGQHANPQASVEALLESLLNLETRRLFRDAVANRPHLSVVGLGPRRTLPVRYPQGQIIRAIKAILVDQPEGLTIQEIHEAAERALDREIAVHTIRAGLAEHTDHYFIRVRRGIYRLTP